MPCVDRYAEETMNAKLLDKEAMIKRGGPTVCVTGAGTDGAKPSDWKNDKA